MVSLTILILRYLVKNIVIYDFIHNPSRRNVNSVVEEEIFLCFEWNDERLLETAVNTNSYIKIYVHVE